MPPILLKDWPVHITYLDGGPCVGGPLDGAHIAHHRPRYMIVIGTVHTYYQWEPLGAYWSFNP